MTLEEEGNGAVASFDSFVNRGKPAKVVTFMMNRHFLGDRLSRPPKTSGGDTALPDLEVDPPPLITSAQAWWRPPAAVMEAAADFDRRHRMISRRAHAVMGALERDVSSYSKREMLDAITNETRLNRYVAPKPGERVIKLRKGRQRPPPVPTPWTLESSIWGSRKVTCDSCDFYDSPEVIAKMVGQDWARARDAHKLASFIVRYDDQGDADEDGDGEADEVQEVERMLYEHAELLLQIFDYYAVTGGSTSQML